MRQYRILVRHERVDRHGMRGVALALAGAVAALAAIGCGTLLASDQAALVLRTDRTEYIARVERGDGARRRYGFTVVARVQNRGSTLVYLARCMPDSPHPTYSVNLVDGEDRWGPAYNMAWGCVGHDRQIGLAPGETRTDTLHLSGPNLFDGRTHQPFGVLTGRMRLRYQVQTCRGDGACRVRDVGASNAFDVTLAPH